MYKEFFKRNAISRLGSELAIALGIAIFTLIFLFTSSQGSVQDVFCYIVLGLAGGGLLVGAVDCLICLVSKNLPSITLAFGVIAMALLLGSAVVLGFLPTNRDNGSWNTILMLTSIVASIASLSALVKSIWDYRIRKAKQAMGPQFEDARDPYQNAETIDSGSENPFDLGEVVEVDATDVEDVN